MKLCLLAPLLMLGAATASAQMPASPTAVAWADRYAIHAGTLNETREVLVAVPRAYATSGVSYPVLYVLDGEWHFEHAVAVARFLSETSYLGDPRIPEMIVVGVVNTDRNRDYTPTHRARTGSLQFPTSGGSAGFVTFLEEDLFPFIERRYRTQPYRAVTGWSFGGLFAVHTLLTAPALFNAYVAISPSLWWDDDLLVGMADSLMGADADAPRSLVITLGGETGSIRPAVLSFVDTLEQRAGGGLDWTFLQIDSVSHNLVAPVALYEGLQSLYQGWMLPAERLAQGMAGVTAHYDSLSTAMGYPVPVPEATFVRLARRHWGNNQFEDAFTVCERRVQLYPASPGAYFFRGAAHENLGQLASALTDYSRAVALESKRTAPSQRDLDQYHAAVARVSDGQ